MYHCCNAVLYLSPTAVCCATLGQTCTFPDLGDFSMGLWCSVFFCSQKQAGTENATHSLGSGFSLKTYQKYIRDLSDGAATHRKCHANYSYISADMQRLDWQQGQNAPLSNCKVSEQQGARRLPSWLQQHKSTVQQTGPISSGRSSVFAEAT